MCPHTPHVLHPAPTSHTGGILANQSDTVVALVDPMGGHHADLSWTTPADLASLNATRAAERALLLRWLDEYRAGGGAAGEGR